MKWKIFRSLKQSLRIFFAEFATVAAELRTLALGKFEFGGNIEEADRMVGVAGDGAAKADDFFFVAL